MCYDPELIDPSTIPEELFGDYTDKDYVDPSEIISTPGISWESLIEAEYTDDSDEDLD